MIGRAFSSSGIHAPGCIMRTLTSSPACVPTATLRASRSAARMRWRDSSTEVGAGGSCAVSLIFVSRGFAWFRIHVNVGRPTYPTVVRRSESLALGLTREASQGAYAGPHRIKEDRYAANLGDASGNDDPPQPQRIGGNAKQLPRNATRGSQRYQPVRRGSDARVVALVFLRRTRKEP